MQHRRAHRRILAARAVACAAVSAALIVPLTAAGPGSRPAGPTAPEVSVASGTAAPAGERGPRTSSPGDDQGEDGSSSPSPEATHSPESNPEGKEPSPAELTAVSTFHHVADGAGYVTLHRRTDDDHEEKPLTGADIRPFSCPLPAAGGGETTLRCALSDTGVLIDRTTERSIPQPAARAATGSTDAGPHGAGSAGSAPEGGAPKDAIFFSQDPDITLTVNAGKADLHFGNTDATVTDRPGPSPSPSPTDGYSPAPTPSPSRSRTPEPEPSTSAEHVPTPPEDDAGSGTSTPPAAAAPEDPNSGSGQRSPRIPGQSGDDWVPAGGGGGEYNYADPVPEAPGSNGRGEDAISADGPVAGETPGGSASSGTEDQNAEDATDMTSATGSMWAIVALLGFAAICVALVLYVLGRQRRSEH